jgi:hypothetical protein
MLLSSQSMAPVEALEATTVTIGGDPCAARFNRDRCGKSIENEISARARSLALGFIHDVFEAGAVVQVNAWPKAAAPECGNCYLFLSMRLGCPI